VLTEIRFLIYLLNKEIMKKIIRLTESDLTRIVRRVIKENDDYKDRSMNDPYYSDDEDDSSDEVKKLISIIEENNLVDKEDINIYSDHIEVYSINGCDSEYFMENFIRLYPDDIDNGYIRVDGENYEEEIDDEEYQEVLDYIFENWEPLLDIEFIV
jgi:hypothetical protein